MHELSIAEAIVRAVSDENRGKLTGIGLRIGELTDLVADALRFSFEALISGTELEGCELILEYIPPGGVCRSCGHEVVVKGFEFRCPHCSSHDLNLTRGQELEIVYLRVQTEETQE